MLYGTMYAVAVVDDDNDDDEEALHVKYALCVFRFLRSFSPTHSIFLLPCVYRMQTEDMVYLPAYGGYAVY